LAEALGQWINALQQRSCNTSQYQKQLLMLLASESSVQRVFAALVAIAWEVFFLVCLV
jgi:hypothetical protein